MRDGVTDANTTALTDALKDFPNAKAQTRQQFTDNQIAGFTTVLNIIYVLLALSVVVSFFGIVNTLVLTVTSAHASSGCPSNRHDAAPGAADDPA